MPEILSCRDAWNQMTAATKSGHLVRNYTVQIRMNHYTVETDLFPVEALQVYSDWNLGRSVSSAMKDKYFSAHRGGAQGDYREGMPEKIANVVDCLARFPHSKRAVITISNNPAARHTSDNDAKCMRELHFHLENHELNATVLFRAQAAEIFPKNIHFIGALMEEICRQLPEAGTKPGVLFYHATVLVSDRA